MLVDWKECRKDHEDIAWKLEFEVNAIIDGFRTFIQKEGKSMTKNNRTPRIDGGVKNSACKDKETPDYTELHTLT